MGWVTVKGVARIAPSLLLGLAAGVAFAKLDFPGFRHGVVVIRKGAETKPIYMNGAGGSQLLALTMKNLQTSGRIEVRMQGARIESWYPPVVVMPFNKGMTVTGGSFDGVEFGRRLPVYISFNDNGEDRQIDIIDSADRSLIRTVQVLRGEGNEKERH